jgi:lysine-N-methylase
MSLPVRHLPVLQNWDCHGCTDCCRQYQVPVTDEERRLIESQGWDKDEELGDLPLFVRTGPWWRRGYRLSDRGNGDCIFLSPQGRCRIHERFGSNAKPLACRLFPYVLIPMGDHWRVTLRFACPSAAANRGKPLAEHNEELTGFASELEVREDMAKRQVPAPPLQGGQRVAWPDVLRFIQALVKLLRERDDAFERRMRKCLALAKLCRQARFDKVAGDRLSEFLALVGSGLDALAPAASADTAPPSWIGRILFRQALALYVRKDHGPERGPATHGRLALLGAAYRFAKGRGKVPAIHRALPETTFELVEAANGSLPAEADEVLERYYVAKVFAGQFCGPTNFNQSFWDGFESLALTLPVILWLMRAFHAKSTADAAIEAIRIVDDHLGLNPLLGKFRQRLASNILARRGELERLIAWYSR